MSVIVFNPVGKQMPAFPTVGLGHLGQTFPDPKSALEGQYMTLREKCLENYGPDFCNAVLPRNMVYAVTRRDEGYTLPWWLWMLIGGIAVKFLRL